MPNTPAYQSNTDRTKLQGRRMLAALLCAALLLLSPEVTVRADQTPEEERLELQRGMTVQSNEIPDRKSVV